jgi:hypothetical protein
MPGPNAPYTQLDADQVLKQAFDEENDRLRVETAATIVAGAVEVSTNSINDSMAIGNTDGSSYLEINTDGSVKTVQLFTEPFDSITATYPSSTQEIYQSRIGGISGSVQQTLTVNYTDTTKNFILNVART